MAGSLFHKIRLPWRTRTRMSPAARQEISRKAVAKAISLGASLAGIADVTALRDSPSHGLKTVRWPPDARSAIVLALGHPSSDLPLDRWDGQPGGTPGNRRLIRTGSALVRWLKQHHRIEALMMPYQVGRGGIFLKDAAVLAGLGTIGRNNLVVTPAFGPRIRLRAILMGTRLEPTGPLTGFAPCGSCQAFCRSACPQDAFRSGSYDHRCCLCQMLRDENAATPGQTEAIQYCRACELACPVGRDEISSEG